MTTLERLKRHDCWRSSSTAWFGPPPPHDLAAEYLLDNRYASALSAADAALRDVLTQLESVDDLAKSSAGWRRIMAALRSLGAT